MTEVLPVEGSVVESMKVTYSLATLMTESCLSHSDFLSGALDMAVRASGMIRQGRPM
jgi:hypothetical protein